MSVGWWACVFIFDWVPLPLVFPWYQPKAQTNVGKGEGKVHTVVGNVLFCLLHVCSFLPTHFPHPQLKLLLPFPAVHLFRYLKLIQCHSKSNNPPRSKKHATHPQVIWVQSYKLRKYFFCLGSFEITRLHFSLLYWRSNIVAMLKRLFKDTCLLLLLLMMIFATIRCPEFISQIEEVMCPLQCWSWVLSPSRPRPNCLELTSYITRLNSHLFLSVDNE
jgi:hypothetical protein